MQTKPSWRRADQLLPRDEGETIKSELQGAREDLQGWRVRLLPWSHWEVQWHTYFQLMRPYISNTSTNLCKIKHTNTKRKRIRKMAAVERVFENSWIPYKNRTRRVNFENHAWHLQRNAAIRFPTQTQNAFTYAQQLTRWMTSCPRVPCIRSSVCAGGAVWSPRTVKTSVRKLHTQQKF